MRLRVTHDTCYRYARPVRTALHMAHLTPPETRCQQRIDARLEVDPSPVLLTETPDIYRNQRAFFEIASAHERLRVRATSLVVTQAPDAAPSRVAWNAVAESFVYHAGTDWHPAAEFIYPSVYVHPGMAFADYARSSFTLGRPLIEAARELMQRIHQDFMSVSFLFGERVRRQWPPALSRRRRGSTAKYSRSTIRLMTTKISAVRHRYAAITGMSANVTAWMNSSPMPGH